ncbi:MAG: hypothetical protein LUD19_05605 [Clostridia bacterium]|nr:hypothetical protein [Clostridia bacterium]
MEDQELEEKLKQSASEIRMKDFSERQKSINAIIDNAPEQQKELIFAEQPVTAGVNGGTHRGARTGVIIAVAAVLFAALIAVCIFFIFKSGSSADDSLSGAQEDGYSYGSSFAEDASINGTAVTQSAFYAAFGEEEILVADFTSNSDVTYYLTYGQDGSLYGGYVLFNYAGNAVCVELYVSGYDGEMAYNCVQNNSVIYVVNGDLPDDDLQYIMQNISS